MSSQAFMPTGPSSRVTANTTAPAGVQVVAGTSGPTCFRFYNAHTECVSIGYGKSAIDATASAAFPTGNTSATATNSWQLPSGAVEVLRTPMQNPFFSILSPTANGNCFITPGEGL